jgi:hypothetical protein
VSQIASFVADIASSTPPNNPQATTPLVQIGRPVAQIAASAGGPLGSSILSIIGLVASALAGAGIAGTGVAASKNKKLTAHNQALTELANATPDKSKLTPATQHLVAQVAAGV